MTNQEVKASIIHRIVVVVPEFKQWTGTRAMHEGDFQVGTDGKLPPKEVTKSLGLKAIIDSVHLREFDRIKHRAEALLAGCGVRYLSGWAIPDDKSAQVLQALDRIVASYIDAKTMFLLHYDEYVEAWAQKNPSFADGIRNSRLSPNDVASRFSAGYEAFRLQPVSDEKAVALEQSLGGLAGELLDDVSQCAKTFFRESFLGKDRANRKTVNALLRIRERLNGLSFLSKDILPLVSLIDEVAAAMPKEGYFGGDAFWKLSSVVQTLADKTLMEGIIRRQVSVEGLAEHSTAMLTTETEVPEANEETVVSQPDLLAGMDEFFEETAVGNGDEQSDTLSDADRQTVVTLEHEFSDSQPVTNDDDKMVDDNTDGASASEMTSPKTQAIPDVDVGDGMYF